MSVVGLGLICAQQFSRTWKEFAQGLSVPLVFQNRTEKTRLERQARRQGTLSMGHMWLVRNMHRCDDEADNPGRNSSHVRTYLLKQQLIGHFLVWQGMYAFSTCVYHHTYLSQTGWRSVFIPMAVQLPDKGHILDVLPIW